MNNRRRTIFVDRDGVVRSGWAIAIVVLLNVIAGIVMTMTMSGMLQSVEDPAAAVSMAVRLLVAIASTWVGCRLVRQPLGAAGFADSRKLLHCAIGCALGIVLMALTVGVPWAIGAIGLAATPHGASTLIRAGAIQLAVMTPASVSEEILVRGFLLQQLARGLGPIAAIAVTSLLFGLIHLFNPDATLAGAAAITLVGVWFALLVMATRSLWLTFGLHTAWNVFEGFVFGQPVSGYDLSVSILRRTEIGSTAWTGGAFGPEASAWLAVLLVIAIVTTFFVVKVTLR